MSVDVFGRQLVNSKEVHRGPPGVGFSLTDSGDYDIQNKTLCNVRNPANQFDAINLQTLQKSINDRINDTENELNSRFDEVFGLHRKQKESINKLEKSLNDMYDGVSEMSITSLDRKIINLQKYMEEIKVVTSKTEIDQIIRQMGEFYTQISNIENSMQEFSEQIKVIVSMYKVIAEEHSENAEQRATNVS